MKLIKIFNGIRNLYWFLHSFTTVSDTTLSHSYSVFPSFKNEKDNPELDMFLHKFTHEHYPMGIMQLLKKIPPEHYWHFFIDGQHQIEGQHWGNYEEREPGFLEGMSCGFYRVLQALKVKERLSVQLIKELHSLALKNVKNTNYNSCFQKKLNRSEFDDVGLFGIVNVNKSSISFCREGVIEILMRMYKTNSFKEIRHCEFGSINSISIKKFVTTEKDISKLADKIHTKKSGSFYTKRYHSIKNLNKVVSHIVLQYQEAIDSAETAFERIKIITHCIRELEHFHPYIDGNGRTFCTLVLNFLLMSEGFPPVILLNPNQFDGYDFFTLTDMVINGMQSTYNLVTSQKVYGEAVKTGAILEKVSFPSRLYFQKTVQILSNFDFLVVESKEIKVESKEIKAESKEMKEESKEVKEERKEVKEERKEYRALVKAPVALPFIQSRQSLFSRVPICSRIYSAIEPLFCCKRKR